MKKKKKKVEVRGGKNITVSFIDHVDDELEAIWASVELMGLAGQQSNRSIQTEVAVLCEDLAYRVVTLKDFIYEKLENEYFLHERAD